MEYSQAEERLGGRSPLSSNPSADPPIIDSFRGRHAICGRCGLLPVAFLALPAVLRATSGTENVSVSSVRGEKWFLSPKLRPKPLSTLMWATPVPSVSSQTLATTFITAPQAVPASSRGQLGSPPVRALDHTSASASLTSPLPLPSWS